MGWYPRAIADVRRRVGVEAFEGRARLASLGHYWGVGQPLADDGYKAVGDMQVGEYTLDATEPDGDFPRNFTVTHADVGGTDTLGTIEVVGLDAEGYEHTEVITPVANSTVQGTYCFASIISVTGVGWVISGVGDEDQIEFGWGDLIGLPYKFDRESVLMATIDGVEDIIAAQRAHDTFIDWNNILLTSALGVGERIDIYFVV